MKHILLILLLCAGYYPASAQNRYRTGTGEIRFDASTPLEDITATNQKVNAILDTITGEFAVVLLVRDFRFPRKLMQEHFNENYMESDRYPKAFFRGRLTGFSPGLPATGTVAYQVEGELYIHNVSRKINPEARLSREGGDIRLETEFVVRPESYGVEVPRLLFNKIAEEVHVRVNLGLKPEKQGSGDREKGR